MLRRRSIDIVVDETEVNIFGGSAGIEVIAGEPSLRSMMIWARDSERLTTCGGSACSPSSTPTGVQGDAPGWRTDS